MCTTCGCDDPAGARVTNLAAASSHVHRHDHASDGRTVTLEERVLAKNDLLATANRRLLASRSVHAVNLMSSPGSGKTTLLVRTVRDLMGRIPVAVVEGDQETLLDAERVRTTGCPVVQINTGMGCHLDAAMLERALAELDPRAGSLVFVENVGNLVCPALFDLGEGSRVVVMSVTEGADKPAKYPHMFRTADLVLLNKIDLLPHVDFDVARCTGQLHALNPRAPVLQLSAYTGEGMGAWCTWLQEQVQANRQSE
jgi:hydrogenase nickel incorporation protein HypB